MDEYSPASLPQITDVDIVDLKEVRPSQVSQYIECATNAPLVKIRGIQAERIADLWRELPTGMQSRCHTPPFGFRFYRDGQEVCRGSICWDCDNIFGDAAGKAFHYEFDSRSPAGISLLNEALQAFGHETFPYDSSSP